MKYHDIVKQKSPWFAAKSVFHDESNRLYEERTVLVNAQSHDEALDRGREEAESYARNTGLRYTGYSEVFQLFDTDLQDGAELFSTMRESNLPPAAYLKRFVATGTEVGIDREEV